jgi:SAM-dependent methyltransferase
MREPEWFDDEAFWEATYPFMFGEERFAQAPEQVEKALALAGPRGTAALDLCCGPGRCAIELAKGGFSVTGVDRTEFLLKKARERAEGEGVPVEWVQTDMRDFVRPGAFDLVLNMFTSFGYFDDKGEDLAVLANLFESLRPGGVLLIDVMGKERLARVMQPTTSEVLPDGSMLVQRHEIFDDWTRIGNEWTVIRDGRSQTFTFHLTVYSGQELRDRLGQVGFAPITLYGSLDGDPYDFNAHRLIAVARKGGGAEDGK